MRSVPENVEVRYLKADEKGRLACCDIRYALRDFRCVLIEGRSLDTFTFHGIGLAGSPCTL